MLTRKSALKPGKGLTRKTAMARGTAQLARASKPMAAVGQRGKRMRQGRVSATPEESAWMDAVQAIGCIVCRLQHGASAAAEIHHLKAGDRRRGHLWTLPLCPPHHRGGDGTGLFISRHPWKVRFEAAYGTELVLLAAARALVSDQGKNVPALPNFDIS